MSTPSAFALLPSFRRLALAGLASLPLLASGQTILGFSPAQAAAGSVVTLTGTGLGSLKSVMLNGQAMRVTGTPTASSVSVIVPPAAATGRMRLTTAAGTSLTDTKLGITRQSSAVSYGQQSSNSSNATATGNFSTPTMGDLDNDGLVEMIVGQGNGTIIVFEQTAARSTAFGAGTLLKNADGTTLSVGKYAKPTLTDLDGNGLVELLVGEDTGNVLRYEQTAATGTGALAFTKNALFTNPLGTATTNAPNGGSYARPTVADLDNNGLLDVLVGSNDGTLRRYEQTAANKITFNTLGQMKLADGTVINVGEVDKPLLTDYNGDGFLDMLLGNKAGSVMLYTQTGTDAVTFRSLGNLTTNGTTAVNMSTERGYAAPAITDIDGDGLLDLFVGNANGTVYRFQQTQSASSPALSSAALASPTPMPVVLTAFTGQTTAAGNVLRWATASETNSDHFEVERSADGQTFVKIGQVAAAGASTATRSYQFADATTPAAISYYRLRQVDYDGTSAYSPVVTLAASTNKANADKPVAYPTVFTTELSVVQAGAAAPATVVLLTADGRPVYTRTVQLGATPQALAELPTLAPGQYFLRIATAAGTTMQKLAHN